MNPSLISTDLQERDDLHQEWGLDYYTLLNGYSYTPAVEPTVFTEESGFKFTKHWMSDAKEWFSGPFKKHWFTIHDVAGWDNPFQVIDTWEKDTRGPIATEWIIGGQCINNVRKDYDGVIVQVFPKGGWGYHWSVGNVPMHRESVAVELNCFGWVENGKNYVGLPVSPEQIVTLQFDFRGHKQYHRISTKQIESLKTLMNYVSRNEGIDIGAGLPAMVKNLSKKEGIKGIFKAFDFCDPQYIALHPGTWTHANTTLTKSDLFPQEEIIELFLSL